MVLDSWPNCFSQSCTYLFEGGQVGDCILKYITLAKILNPIRLQRTEGRLRPLGYKGHASVSRPYGPGRAQRCPLRQCRPDALPVAIPYLGSPSLSPLFNLRRCPNFLCIYLLPLPPLGQTIWSDFPSAILEVQCWSPSWSRDRERGVSFLTTHAWWLLGSWLQDPAMEFQEGPGTQGLRALLAEASLSLQLLTWWLIIITYVERF